MELSTKRNHIIDKMQSRMMSVDEFNFDHLMAPPLYSFLTQYDIDQLRYIATSIRYSGKINQKYKAIDQIMKSRGFVKLVAGTNRVCYRHLEYDDIVVKVAVDAVGIHDNPEEFKNQHIFKPFVTKVFEVSPCGTVGLFERVVPITSREEFQSVATDIFDVISNWFVGEYVLADIGTKFFMNWGIRKGFGPVLLDFPYCYQLDGNKLYCRNPDPSNPTGFCDGVIDYDDGYNYLYCTKCGKRYKATELKKAVDRKEIIIGGNNKMAKELVVSVKKVKIDENGNIVRTSNDLPTTPKHVEFKTAAPKITSGVSTAVPVQKPKNTTLEVSVKKVPVDEHGNRRKDKNFYKQQRKERRQQFSQQQQKNNQNSNNRPENNQQPKKYNTNEDTSMKRGTVMSGPSNNPVDNVNIPSVEENIVTIKKGMVAYFSSLDKEHDLMFIHVGDVTIPVKISSIPQFVFDEYSNCENLEAELEQAKSDLIEMEEKLDECQSDQMQTAREYEDLQKNFDLLKEDNDSAHAIAAGLESDIKALREENAKLGNELLEATSNLTMYKEQIAGIEKLKTQIEDQRNNLESYMNKCSELETRNGELDKNVTRLNHIIDDKKKEINAVQAELANLQHSYDDLLHEVQETPSEVLDASDANPTEDAKETTENGKEKYMYDGFWRFDGRLLRSSDCINLYKVDPNGVPKDIADTDKTIMVLVSKDKDDIGLLTDVNNNLVVVDTLEGDDFKVTNTLSEQQEALLKTIPDDEEENDSQVENK